MVSSRSNSAHLAHLIACCKSLLHAGQFEYTTLGKAKATAWMAHFAQTLCTSSGIPSRMTICTSRCTVSALSSGIRSIRPPLEAAWIMS